MQSPTRDETTREFLQRSHMWKVLTGQVDMMQLAKAGPLELEQLTDRQHDEIRFWCEHQGNYADAPLVLKQYLDLFT